MTSPRTRDPLRRAVVVVAALNLGYFGVEFAVALAIGSVSLFADSIDFLEDASIDLLIAIALGWSARSRARVGMLLASILLAPGLATIWMAWRKFGAPLPPEPLALTLTALGALAVNLGCGSAATGRSTLRDEACGGFVCVQQRQQEMHPPDDAYRKVAT